jgi:hypothetical protein
MKISFYMFEGSCGKFSKFMIHDQNYGFMPNISSFFQPHNLSPSSIHKPRLEHACMLVWGGVDETSIYVVVFAAADSVLTQVPLNTFRNDLFL